MHPAIKELEKSFQKKAVVDVKSGDTVRVHQKIREGSKERIQIFEGLVIRVRRKSSLMSDFTVRRIASGVGVEKTYLIHSPSVTKVEVTKRSKVRRNYLTYMRLRSGKKARLAGVDFDKHLVNNIHDEKAEEAEALAKEEAAKIAEEKAAEVAKAKAENDAKVAEALSAHDKA